MMLQRRVAHLGCSLCRPRRSLNATEDGGLSGMVR